MSLAIETYGLSKSYGEFQAVKGVDISVERGSLYGFLGPNGAGKSTTIKMLTGILTPSSGGAQLLGRNPWDPKQGLEVKRRTGVVPESLALFDNLTAREYLAFVGRMHRLDKQTILTRSEELLGILKLEGVEKKFAVEYSHGMKKKLALAAALIHNPELLFLDEPFEGIDAVTASVIRDILLDYVAKGATVFVTSHVLEIVERICTHVGIIAHGELVEQSSLTELRRGNSLERRFLELVGDQEELAKNLDWLDGGLVDSESENLASNVVESEKAEDSE